MSTEPPPPAVIDEDRFVVRRTIHIAAGIDKVWAAITRPEHISRWFGETVLNGTGPGAHGTVTWPGRRPVPIRIDDAQEPTRISYRWSNTTDELDHVETVFTFTLEPAAEGTVLTVVETGFDATGEPEHEMRSHRDGWTSELDTLVSLLERDR